jgi:hypothetical protein
MSQVDSDSTSWIVQKRFRATLSGLGLLLLAGCIGSQQLSQNSVAEEAWQFELLDGREIMPFEDSNVKAIVLVFIATDCPIANAYLPEIAKIQKRYSKQGIQILLVHPDRDITKADAETHARQFRIDIPIVLDTELRIARRVNAEVTPQAIVVRRGITKPAYRGAIDNQYEGYGKKRPAPDKHYLIEALSEILSNKPVSNAETKPVGCFISYDEL